MRRDQNGFSLVELVILLVVLSLLTLAGLQVYNSKKADAPGIPGKSNVTSKKIVAVGDIACSLDDPNFLGEDNKYCQSAKTHALVAGINPDAILVLGDLQYNKGELSHFLGSYNNDWGKEKAITYPTPGNHEYETLKAAGYFEYFNGSNSNGRAGEIGKGYYSFNLGDWHIVALNSNCQSVGGCDKNSAQTDWLRQDLDTATKACTLAFWHHPLFTSGKYLNSATENRGIEFWEVLAAHKADVILNGHDHLYERFAPQTPKGVATNDGIRQFTAGTGGKILYQQKGEKANSEKIIDDSFGVLELELLTQAYKWRFISVDGQVQDSGQQNCT